MLQMGDDSSGVGALKVEASNGLDSATDYLKLKICFHIFSYLANSLYSFSPKP